MLRTRVKTGWLAGFVMSLVFGGLVVLIQDVENLVPPLLPTFESPSPITLRVPAIQHEGEALVIPRGTVLRPDAPDHVAAVNASTRRNASRSHALASLAIQFTLFLLATNYLRRFGTSRTRLLHAQLGVFGLIVAALAVAKGMLLFTPLAETWIPMSAIALWCAIVFDRRTSFVVNVLAAFMASSLLAFDLPLLTVFITRGMAASLLLTRRHKARQLVVAGGLAGATAAIIYAAIRTLAGGSEFVTQDIASGWASPLLGVVGGGVLGGAVAVFLREPAERALGAVSRERLVELTDLEQPLLQKMAREAPGSWEHSRAMANLAEAAAAAIGADPLLTRVGAYYHDLGKTIQPKYFVENLLHGERSPHEDLEPDVSADAIMAHVVQGTKILRDGRIPEPVVEFAYTHHGTQTIEFFWHKCQRLGNPKQIPESYFRYPGMRPQSRETAILMLVDSIEAASRTVDPPERARFEEMIQRVLFTKLKSGQLDESGLTVEDLRILTVRMAETLVNMYHGRVKYPWQADTSKEPKPGASPSEEEPPSRKPTSEAKGGGAANEPEDSPSGGSPRQN